MLASSIYVPILEADLSSLKNSVNEPPLELATVSPYPLKSRRVKFAGYFVFCNGRRTTVLSGNLRMYLRGSTFLSPLQFFFFSLFVCSGTNRVAREKV